MLKRTKVVTVEDITDEIREMARSLVDEYYPCGCPVENDTMNFIDMMEEYPIGDGSYLSFGPSMDSPAIQETIHYAQEYRSEKMK